MAMNLVHRVLCNSSYWARDVQQNLVPWALADVELGDSKPGLSRDPAGPLAPQRIPRC